MTLEILRKYNIKAKKSLGQNFLVNENIVTSISEVIEISGKNIIEVGPGYGALTEKLINKKPKTLNLVELDKDMIEILNKRKDSGDFDLNGIDFNINNCDVLKYNPTFSDYSVIANIPYYITSPILRHFLYDVENKPEFMVILMQKDVGDKILGKGKEKTSVLSLFVSKKCIVSEVLFVGKENFIPAPKVESSVLLFETHNLYNHINDNDFMVFIKKAFSEPRKKLSKNLEKAGYDKDLIIQVFSKYSIGDNTRGEDLNISIWCDIFLEFNK
ncbi:MAG: 16S rRNA (adenine(1518)-N(6)/adenine(1519)-N(6))-dimethyltransferase RsmA [Candidatus Gracilibacteria bacterium]|nr:16S rRNA (adenine(1518)-N(6)/adenine(1519)-N(6))-dimethyltransferase RsmA [Candidatus Gracilibacteria bacterium]